jgi:hypothetical protein
MKLEVLIELHTRRCYECGKWWSGEHPGLGQCPMCADKKIGAALDEQDRLGRVVRSLRGAITRSKRRRK